MHTLQQDRLHREAPLEATRCVQRGFVLGLFTRELAIREVRILIEPCLGDEIGVALDVRIAAFLQVSI